MMDMKPVNAVQDVNALINAYGLEMVEAAISYLKTVNTAGVKFTDGNTSWYLNPTQVHAVVSVWNSGYGKIQAIKLFREYTSCGLKEAKDAIERHFAQTQVQTLSC